jgi:hypothetical protein
MLNVINLHGRRPISTQVTFKQAPLDVPEHENHTPKLGILCMIKPLWCCVLSIEGMIQKNMKISKYLI